MPEQLWETTMNPETRILKQLVVDDIAEANMTFSSLMGARVRKARKSQTWLILLCKKTDDIFTNLDLFFLSQVDARKELIKNAATTISLQHLDI